MSDNQANVNSIATLGQFSNSPTSLAEAGASAAAAEKDKAQQRITRLESELRVIAETMKHSLKDFDDCLVRANSFLQIGKTREYEKSQAERSLADCERKPSSFGCHDERLTVQQLDEECRMLSDAHEKQEEICVDKSRICKYIKEQYDKVNGQLEAAKSEAASASDELDRQAAAMSSAAGSAASSIGAAAASASTIHGESF